MSVSVSVRVSASVCVLVPASHRSRPGTLWHDRLQRSRHEPSLARESAVRPAGSDHRDIGIRVASDGLGAIAPLTAVEGPLASREARQERPMKDEAKKREETAPRTLRAWQGDESADEISSVRPTMLRLVTDVEIE